MRVGAELLEREHGPDDVDDRVERADLVQVDAIEGRAVDGCFGLAQPGEETPWRDPCRAAQARESIRQKISARVRCAYLAARARACA